MARVLVVDDEPDIRFLVREAYSATEHEVVEAAHGAVAIKQVGLAKPNLVITDIMMPVMDGREFIVWLRARQETLAIPILALTHLRPMDVGADAVLRKPFEKSEVLAAGLALLAGS